NSPASHPFLQGARHQNRGGAFHRRYPFPPRPLRGRGHLHRPAQFQGQLSEHEADPGGGRTHQFRRHPPRVRLPFGKRQVRRNVRREPHHFHRAFSRLHPVHGRQELGQIHHEKGRSAHHSRLRRPGGDPQGRGGGRPRRRLSRHRQGHGRRRRARHARSP